VEGEGQVEEIIVDASVIAKWYIIEEPRENALKMRDDYIDGRIRLSAPFLMPFEVLNAVRYARKDISPTALTKVAESLTLYGIKLCELRGEYARETVETALENEITIYDASYVALAKVLSTVMYTSDQDLITKLKDNYKSYIKHLEDYK